MAVTQTDRDLEELCRELELIEVHLEKVEHRFFKHFQPDKRADYGFLTGKLGEIHTLERAEELTRRNPSRIRIYQLQTIEKRERYSYHPSINGMPNITVKKKGRRGPVNEVDLVVEVSGRPVIIETHLSRYSNSGDGSLRTHLGHTRVEWKKWHIKRLSGAQPMIVYVILPEYTGIAECDTSSIAIYIQEEGNHLVYSSFMRAAWCAHVEEIIHNERRRQTRQSVDATDQRQCNPAFSSPSFP